MQRSTMSGWIGRAMSAVRRLFAIESSAAPVTVVVSLVDSATPSPIEIAVAANVGPITAPIVAPIAAPVQRLLAARRLGYESADLVIDVERLAPQEVTKKIIDWSARWPRSGGPVAHPPG